MTGDAATGGAARGAGDESGRRVTRAGLDTAPEDVDATICFRRRTRAGTDEVLLIWKKRGIGSQQYNGPGGKVESAETPRAAAVRELHEEVGLRAEAVRYAGDLHFVFDHDPFMDVRVFETREFSGVAMETAEADPEWVPVDDVPYGEMWEDDRVWLPHVLAGRTVAGRFYFRDDGDRLETFTLDVADG